MSLAVTGLSLERQKEAKTVSGLSRGYVCLGHEVMCVMRSYLYERSAMRGRKASQALSPWAKPNRAVESLSASCIRQVMSMIFILEYVQVERLLSAFATHVSLPVGSSFFNKIRFIHIE